MISPITKRNTGNWKQHVGAAQEVWAELTTVQLIKSEGQEQELTRLVAKTYAIPREEARQQVIAFVGRHMHLGESG